MTDIAVIVPTSPIKSHPETSILEETLDSIRHHLPTAPIYLTFDGLREEHSDRKADYDEYTRRALWLAEHKYNDIVPYVFYDHQHQSGMLQYTIDDDFDWPLVLYVEHDTPLVTDRTIGWELVSDHVLWGHANLVRFHHEDEIPSEHMHMMLNGDDFSDTFLPTSQWSQRPHLASTAFYRRILLDHFEGRPGQFIEDRMHGVVDEAYRIDGRQGWDQYRLCIYNSGLGERIKRSYHLDGRAGEVKYE